MNPITKNKSRSHRYNLTIDTLAMAQRLRAVGVPEAQANEQVEIIAEVFEHNISTKHDIEVIRKDIEGVRAELKTEMYQMKSNIIIWVAGLLLAQAALITTLQKLL